MDELYTQNTYEGRPHFECTRCPYDTFDEDQMDHHQDTKHPDASTSPQPVVPKSAGGPGSGAVSTPPTTPAGGGFASPRPEPEGGREEKGR